MSTTKQDIRLDAAGWARELRPYGRANGARGAFEVAITSVPFLLAWLSMLWAFETGHLWLYAVLIPLTAGFLVRLFMIQHDCGHGSFFPSKRANDWVGRAVGVATLTPYHHWRSTHAVHHASSGNLDRRGIGDLCTLTVDEYLARSRWGRLRYRLYRNPAVMFGVGPLYLFLLQNRLPIGFMRQGWKPWLSVLGTNAAIVAAVALVIGAVGLRAFLWIHVPIVLLAAAAGVWLFYVQHQFEHTRWAKGASWNARDAALHGSSHYHLPIVLRWFTANIGVHHVHHLSSRIPCYRLPEVLRDHAELRDLGRLTLVQSLKGLGLSLWDEERERLVSFKAVRAQNGAA
jgi:omega-6 fatty acid desaturase (delta-12 desaturase)